MHGAGLRSMGRLMDRRSFKLKHKRIKNPVSYRRPRDESREGSCLLSEVL